MNDSTQEKIWKTTALVLAEAGRLLIERCELLELQRGADTGEDCVFCSQRIFGAMRGAGEGDTSRFAHDECYWRRRAERQERSYAELELSVVNAQTKLHDLNLVLEDRAATIQRLEAENNQLAKRLSDYATQAQPVRVVRLAPCQKNTEGIHVWGVSRKDSLPTCLNCGAVQRLE